MNEVFALVLALLTGALLGAIFFGGLWWTIRRGVSSKRPAAWFVVSFLFRTVAAVTGFYLFSRGDWRKLVVCLLGFLIARVFVMRLTRKPVEKRDCAVEGRGL